jgi:dipeptidyl aminopeptidase/acylaminoacyl peptidase
MSSAGSSRSLTVAVLSHLIRPWVGARLSRHASACGAGQSGENPHAHAWRLCLFVRLFLNETLKKHLFTYSLAAAVCLAQAQPNPRIGAILGDLASTRTFEQVAISPDAKRVAWIEELYDNGKDTGNSTIYVKELAGGAPVRINPGKASSDRQVVWSPDSSRMAFLSDREHKGQMQLYVAAASGGRTKKLTSLTGYLTDPQWSHDGSRLAILFAENAPSGGGPLEAEPVETGVIGGEIHNQRLTVVDVNSAAVKQVSPSELHVYEYDWSPDGRSFVLSAAPGPGDNNWWVAQLYTMPADSGKMAAIYRPELQIAMPRWSPDGSTIGFIQGLMSDEGFTGGDVVTIEPTGGQAVNRTAARKSSVSSLEWLSPTKLLITEVVGGGSAIATLDVSSGQTERLWKGDEEVHAGGNFANFSLAHDGKTAGVIRADWQHPPEIWAGPIGDWKQVTQANARLQPKWGPAKNVEWTSDGFSVQGWLLYPRDYDASKRYPMVVGIHGGPANMSTPRWPSGHFDVSILSALGYFVFFPNPRGSYGQGEVFTSANVRDFGYGDLRDILAGVDAVLKVAPVDPNRLGVTGWSYGGYMTMWTVTRTDRFRAAVAGAGIANYQSYYGQNSIDQWMIPYFGASVYDDPAVYMKSSPITFIKRVKTPTLVVVGERDGECPAPQSYEFWHALNTLGVKTQLVVYPGEGHMFRDSGHKQDLMERAVKWFEQYLGPTR